MADDEIRRFMAIRDFVDQGYLQEVNRQFFHPLAMALVADETPLDDGLVLVGIRLTGNADGFVFDAITPDIVTKAQKVAAVAATVARARQAALGYVIQPLDRETALE